ncbi:hypothetical protein TNCV_2993321 [Trichonephila clavipes]|nr:hypothetical protein TNCV_2993321 [Trichonephila clavipes]
MQWYEQQSECCPTQENQKPYREKTKMYDGIVKNNRLFSTVKVKLRHFAPISLFLQARFPHMMIFQNSYSVLFRTLQGSHSVFGYPNNRVSERCPVPIDSDKRRSTVVTMSYSSE